MLEGVEEEDDEESPSSWHKTTTLETSMISDGGYKSRHSQPECGYALEPTQWTEYSIHTMEPDNLELVFEFFEVCITGSLIFLSYIYPFYPTFVSPYLVAFFA